jgi:hypothetical protein
MDLIKKLQKLGYDVKQFTECHYRVDDVFEFWTGKRGWKWHYMPTGERGSRPPDQLLYYIQQRLGDPGTSTHVSKAEFIRRLVEIGWTPGEAEQSWKERQSSHTSSQV